MNVIYLDIDGVLNTLHNKVPIEEKRIQILSSICKKYNCKIVIESTHKSKQSDWKEENPLLIELFNLFEKYEIECIGFTPTVEIHEGCTTIPHWKEFEILSHLYKHKEIKHFVIIDDNDYKDLALLQEYLVETKDYPHDEKESGLLEEHIEKVRKKLLLKNKFN